MSFFWVIDRKTFRNVVEEISTKKFEENRNFQDSIDTNFITTMSESQKCSISQAMINQKFDSGKDLVSKGDQADSYYIIKEVLFFFIKKRELLNA